MARCYEAMDRPEDADECMRQQSLNEPQALVQYYLWAKRLERRDAGAIHKKAVLALLPSDSCRPSFFLAMADDQERKAMDLVWRDFDKLDDAYDVAQELILARKLKENSILTKSLELLKSTDVQNGRFGVALRELALSGDLPAGIAAFDAWAGRQLEDEDSMDWYSLAGRYLVAAGHADEGKAYLIKAIHLSPHERCNYFLAWRELQKMGMNPKQLMKDAARLP
jgi:tetratricopeptide (TPR) repeat protein